MNNYYNISDLDMQKLLNILKNQKSSANVNLLRSLNYQFKKNKDQNPKYRLAAQNLLAKLDNRMYGCDELLVDEDALVSESKNGAYVHCWVWVENENKNKKTRKSVK